MYAGNMSQRKRLLRTIYIHQVHDPVSDIDAPSY